MIDLVDVTQHYGVRPRAEEDQPPYQPRRIGCRRRAQRHGQIDELLGVLGGVLQPQHGHVAIDNRRHRQSTTDELAIRKMAVYLPDQAWLPMRRTGPRVSAGGGPIVRHRLGSADGDVERLLGLFELRTGRLGDQQLLDGPEKEDRPGVGPDHRVPVLLLDEPFSGGLDPAGLLALKHILKRRVKEQQGTVVLTSPVPEIAEEIADGLIILRGGEVAAFETLDGLRKLTGCPGSLADILERLLYPETMQKLAITSRSFRHDPLVTPGWVLLLAG